MNEMSELEMRIAAVRIDESAVLRERVMQAVDDELARQERRGLQRDDEPIVGWSWWWGAAAALILVVINFSFVSASDDGFSPGVRADRMAKNLAALRAMESQQEGMFK